MNPTLDESKQQQLERELRQYEEDSNWLHQRFDELREKYPEQYVAVYRGRIVGNAETISALHAQIKKHCPAAFGHAATEFLPQENLQLIL